MHRKLVPVVAIVCVLAVAGSAGAKDYWFPRVVVDVTVNADGSFQYRESRTYEFEDDFTFAYYEVEKRRLSGGEPADITDFVVSENGAPLERRPCGVLFFRLPLSHISPQCAVRPSSRTARRAW